MECSDSNHSAAGQEKTIGKEVNTRQANALLLSACWRLVRHGIYDCCDVIVRQPSVKQPI